MKRAISLGSLILALALQGCDPFGGGSVAASPTATPVLQFCLGTFVQEVTIQFGTNQNRQALKVDGPCVAEPGLKLGAMPTPVLSSSNAQIILQPYTNDFTVDIRPDAPTLDNCSGQTSLSQSFAVTISVEPGVELGDKYYIAAPVLTNNNLDLLAESAFVHYESIGTIKSVSTTYDFTLTTPSHTRITRFITWQEHFVAGQATVSQGQNNVAQVSSVYAIPTEIDFAGNVEPPGFVEYSTSC